jgi:sulfur transfer complex TusBCD TusB component (DsrH family)
MVQERKSEKRETISSGVWTAQLYKHIEYFNSHNDLRELDIVLPFGIPRERKPKNWEKKQLRKKGINPINPNVAVMKKIATSRLGQFYYRPEAEIKPWKPRLKPMVPTFDQVKHKPALLVLRHDPAEKKVMYLEQDLMAKPITEEIDKKTGFTYRLRKDRNVVVRKFLAAVSQEKFIKLVHEFVKECNRVLYLYCDTR